MSDLEYPLAPLMHRLEVILGPAEEGFQDGYTQAKARAELDLTERKWREIRDRGYLTEPEADAVAVALGTMPQLLWPDVYAGLVPA